MRSFDNQKGRTSVLLDNGGIDDELRSKLTKSPETRKSLEKYAKLATTAVTTAIERIYIYIINFICAGAENEVISSFDSDRCSDKEASF